MKKHNTSALAGLGILRDLESFDLKDIDEAIDDIQKNLGKNYVGDGWNEKLQDIYSLKKFPSNKRLNEEIIELKETLVNKFTEMYGQSEAWVKVFNMVADLQNQCKGRAFVRDGLIIELKEITSSSNVTTEFDEVSA